MTKNLSEVEAFYKNIGQHPLFCRLYVCAECKYKASCTGLDDKNRVSCKQFVPKSGEEFDTSSKWGEMSYWRYNH